MFVPLLSAILGWLLITENKIEQLFLLPEGGLSISQAAEKLADAEEAFNDLVGFVLIQYVGFVCLQI